MMTLSTNDDLEYLPLTFLWQGQVCFPVFYMGNFMELVEDVGAKVNKYS